MRKYDVHFRVSQKEKEVVEHAAIAAGKKVSDYARDILLAASDYPLPDITGEEALPAGTRGRKEVFLGIRVSQEEYAHYIRQAEILDCSVQEYLRKSAAGNKIYVIPGLKEMTKQISKLGVNINQLTTLAHQGKIKEIDLFPCNDTLKQILKALIKLSKQKG